MSGSSGRELNVREISAGGVATTASALGKLALRWVWKKAAPAPINASENRRITADSWSVSGSGSNLADRRRCREDRPAGNLRPAGPVSAPPGRPKFTCGNRLGDPGAEPLRM